MARDYGMAARVRRVAIVVTSLAVLASFWETLSFLADSPYVPGMLVSFETFPKVALDGETWIAFAKSIWVVLIGYLASVLLALPMALLATKSRLFASLTWPLHEFARYIPVPALVSVVLVVLGIDDTAKGAIIFIGTYFHLYFMYFHNFDECPTDAIETARAFGATGNQVLLKVVFRESAPRLWNSSRVAFAWAWSYLLIAELVNSTGNITGAIQQAVRFNPDALLAWLILIGLFGLITDNIFRLAGRYLFPWVKVSTP